jgi:hypothetical protein
LIIIPGPVVGVDGVSASLEGLLFGVADEFGTELTLAAEEGWYGGPAMRDLGGDRPGAHGAFPVRGFRTGRSISMTGLGKATSQATGSRSARALRAVLADGGFGTLTFFDEDSEIMSALVQRDGEVKLRWLTDVTFEYQLSLFAPDSRLYGMPADLPSTALPGGGSGLSWPIGSFFDFGTPPQTGSVVFTNTGTAPTEPTVTISGPLESGFQVVQVETGRRLRYEAPVSGDLVLDNAEGTATAGGQDRTGLLTADDFFTVEPGATSTFQWSSLGSETSADPALMTVAAAPAYY